MSDPGIPHVPASFINAIAEDGTKEEAVRYLQRTWNERCYYQDRVLKLKETVRRMERASHDAADTISKYASEAK